jgi:hypothetical protein
VASVVCIKARGMKDAWCIASSLSERTAAEIVAHTSLACAGSGPVP